MKKPYYARSIWDYERIEGIYNYYKEAIRTAKVPDNYGKWSWDFSPEKTAYEHFIKMTTLEMNYAKGRMDTFRNKNPEEFI